MDFRCPQWRDCIVRWISASGLGVLVLAAGCSSSPQLIPNEGKDTLQVYKDHMAHTREPTSIYRLLRDERRDLGRYTRDQRNEIQQLFPTLPNPEYVMYVFPHITTKGRPVPGYSTAFRLYETEQYALPGEIAP